MGEVNKCMNNVEFNDVIKVVGEINLEMLHNFLEETDRIMEAKIQYDEEMQLIKEQYQSQFPRIILEISSPGGSVDVLNTMLARIDRMRKLGIHVDTDVEGMAYSAAFILAIMGERRVANVWSTWMNHGSSCWVSDKIEGIKNTIDFYDKCDQRMNNLIEKQTELPKEHIEMAKLKDMYYDFDDAVEYGFINSGFEGAEEDEKEFAEKLYHAFDVAIATFGKIAEVDEQEAMGIMHDILDSLRVEVDEEGNVLEGEEEEISEEEFLELLGSEGLQLSELLENDEEETDEELLEDDEE